MQFLGFDVTGKTLGVIGAGRIGTCFALKSAGFNMPVLYTSRHTNTELETKLDARRVSMETLLEASDFISVHVALNTETTHLINAAALNRMKSTAVLINTSRGPVVDERALVDALKTRSIGAAGLDVFEEEPALTPGLAALPNVVICPHVASATIAARTRMATMAATNLIAVLKGESPPNAVV